MASGLVAIARSAAAQAGCGLRGGKDNQRGVSVPRADLPPERGSWELVPTIRVNPQSVGVAATYFPPVEAKSFTSFRMPCPLMPKSTSRGLVGVAVVSDTSARRLSMYTSSIVAC